MTESHTFYVSAYDTQTQYGSNARNARLHYNVQSRKIELISTTNKCGIAVIRVSCWPFRMVSSIEELRIFGDVEKYRIKRRNNYFVMTVVFRKNFIAAMIKFPLEECHAE